MFIVILLILIIGIVYILFSDQHREMVDEQDSNEFDGNNTDKIIVKFNGEDYNITDFIKKHPGGKQVLIENNGKDVDNLMIENEHSVHAYNMLQKYKIKK